MTWRAKLRKGSFRGVPFLTDSASRTGGRRLAVHEYPYVDLPFAEDMGKSGSEFIINAWELGDDYMADRDKLLDALDAPGTGTLTHPYQGNKTVAVADYRVIESTQEGGQATFIITFIESSENVLPALDADTAAKVNDAADQTLADSINNFADSFSVLGQAADYVNGVVDEINRTFEAVENVVGAVTGPIADVIRAPAEMAAVITGSINKISALIDEPERALNIYKLLFKAGEESPKVPTTTSNRQRQAANVEQLLALTRRAAIAEAARTTSTVAFISSDDALRWRDNINTAIDDQAEYVSAVDGSPINDNVYQSLMVLRAAVTTDLNERGAKLPRLVDHTPGDTLPALVIAHQLYGDANRDEEIITRNNIAHPLFIQGGQALEVLSE